MQCRTHPERNGVNTCHQCGDWLCDECTVEINGRIFCRKCLAQLAAPIPPTAPPPPPPVSPGIPPYTHFRTPAPRGRHISGLVLGLLTVLLPIPGVNYMYEGLIKRGLAAMGGFFFIIFALSVFKFWPFSLIFGLAIPIYWLACFFDSLSIRRRINAGETVADDIGDMVEFAHKHARSIVIVIVLLIAMSVAGSIISEVGVLLPLIIVVLGVYMLFRRPKGK